MFSHRFLLVILKSRSLDFTSLSLSVVVIFVALTDLYQSRFVYHLKRRRSPRKLVKYIIVCKCSGFCPKQQKTKQIEKYCIYCILIGGSFNSVNSVLGLGMLFSGCAYFFRFFRGEGTLNHHHSHLAVTTSPSSNLSSPALSITFHLHHRYDNYDDGLHKTTVIIIINLEILLFLCLHCLKKS